MMDKKIERVCCKDMIWARKAKIFPLIFDKEKDRYYLFRANTTEMILLFNCPWCGEELIPKENWPESVIAQQKNPFHKSLIIYPKNIVSQISYYPFWLDKNKIEDSDAFQISLVNEEVNK